MGVFNPTVRNEQELGQDLEYIDNVLSDSPMQERFRDAVIAEINFRDNPTPDNKARRAELLSRCGLKPVYSVDGKWAPPQHPNPAPR